MSFDKLTAAKFVIHALAASGTAKVVKDIIANNTTVESTKDQVLVWIGSGVIGSLVSDVGSQHVIARMDKILEHWETEPEVVVEVSPEQ
jgi:hypothetical protein